MTGQEGRTSKKRANLPAPLDDLRRARRWPKDIPMPKAGPYRSRAKWTHEEEEQLRHYYPLYGGRYVARLLGRSMDAVKIRADRIGVDGTRPRWTAAEIKRLKAEYGKMPIEKLARLLGRTVLSVRTRTKSLGLRKGARRWSEEEIAVLKKLYGTVSAAELARRLDHPQRSVVTKASEMGLGSLRTPITKKAVRYIMKHAGRVPMKVIGEAVRMSQRRVADIARANGYQPEDNKMLNYWRREDEAFLRKNYRTMTTREMARQLGRTPGAVSVRLGVLNLPLDQRYRRRIAKWSNREDEQLRKLYQRLSNRELSIRLNRTVAVVKKRLAALGLRRSGGTA